MKARVRITPNAPNTTTSVLEQLPSQRLGADLQRAAAEALIHDVMIIRILLYEENSFVDRSPYSIQRMTQV